MYVHEHLSKTIVLSSASLKSLKIDFFTFLMNAIYTFSVMSSKQIRTFVYLVINEEHLYTWSLMKCDMIVSF